MEVPLQSCLLSLKSPRHTLLSTPFQFKAEFEAVSNMKHIIDMMSPWYSECVHAFDNGWPLMLSQSLLSLPLPFRVQIISAYTNKHRFSLSFRLVFACHPMYRKQQSPEIPRRCYAVTQSTPTNTQMPLREICEGRCEVSWGLPVDQARGDRARVECCY